MMDLPRLIIVTGRPGSGKTTLSHYLTQEIRCPVICRDRIKEGYMQTKGITEPNDVSVGSAVYEAFFATITLLLQHKVTLIAEAAFQHRLWYPRLGPFREIAEIKILVCSLDAQRAAERGIARGQADPQRRQFHDEALFHRALQGDESPENPYRPPILPVPTLPVDTSDGYQPSLAEIVRFVRSGT